MTIISVRHVSVNTSTLYTESPGFEPKRSNLFLLKLTIILETKYHIVTYVYYIRHVTTLVNNIITI